MCKSSPPTNQNPTFLQARCPSCRPWIHTTRSLRLPLHSIQWMAVLYSVAGKIITLYRICRNKNECVTYTQLCKCVWSYIGWWLVYSVSSSVTHTADHAQSFAVCCRHRAPCALYWYWSSWSVTQPARWSSHTWCLQTHEVTGTLACRLKVQSKYWLNYEILHH